MFRTPHLPWLISAVLLNGQPQPQRVRVPATSNPYLAGMPAGTKATYNDIAPRESPVLIPLLPGTVSVSFEAEGQAAHGPPGQNNRFHSPDGAKPVRHAVGSEHGISDISAPINSLVGVFLDAAPPDHTPAPDEFKPRRSDRDLQPQLKQVFFIGGGKDKKRKFLVPKGATRLFLGVMDRYEWNNNFGDFLVSIAVERSDVSSKLTFADWVCLPNRSQCTPGEAMVQELAPGRYRILLPAHLEWGVSVLTPQHASVKVVDAKGTVCLRNGVCTGPEGIPDRAQTPTVLVKNRPAGALVTKTGGGRTYFSVNGNPGAAFAKHEGFFEFEVSVE